MRHGRRRLAGAGRVAYFFLPLVRTVCVTVVLGFRCVVDLVTKRPEIAERLIL